MPLLVARMFPSSSCHVRTGEDWSGEFGSIVTVHVKLKDVCSNLTTFDGRMIVGSSVIQSILKETQISNLLTNHNNGSSIYGIGT